MTKIQFNANTKLLNWRQKCILWTLIELRMFFKQYLMAYTCYLFFDVINSSVLQLLYSHNIEQLIVPNSRTLMTWEYKLLILKFYNKVHFKIIFNRIGQCSFINCNSIVDTSKNILYNNILININTSFVNILIFFCHALFFIF